MPVAEIIAIGTELLLGEIQDTNTHYLARGLRDLGVDLYRTTAIGDNEERIAQVIREALTRCQIIITTGGLGPTVDDPTRQAVAIALGVETEFQPDLWDQIQERMARYGRKPSENNRRQAFVPAGAIKVPNPVGTAPSFICEVDDRCIISLPGVPREMEFLYHNAVIPYLREHYQLSGIIKARVLHTSGTGESLIDEKIGDLELLGNPTVGLAAHPGQVDIRITAKAASVAEADHLITAVESDIRQRVGDSIYGVDAETLEDVLEKLLAQHGLSLAVYECNLKGELRQRIAAHHLPVETIQVGEGSCSAEALAEIARSLSEERDRVVVLAVSLIPEVNRHILHLYLRTPQGEWTDTRSFGGAPQLGTPWAVNSALDFLRRKL